MNEKLPRYKGLCGGVRPGSGRKLGSLSPSTFKKLATKRLESAINNSELPIGVAILACGLYLLATSTNQSN